MALYTTLHLHNTTAGNADVYASWFDGVHADALTHLRGFKAAERFEIDPVQMIPDQAQPWRYMSVYDFDLPTPAIDVPALGPLIADARDAGLIADDDTERLHTYRLYGDWKSSPNWQRDKPLSGVSILIGNYIAGRFDEYDTWYENVHSVEVANVPGHVAMKRGGLSDVQIEPCRYCPGDQLVMTAQQTDDLPFTIGDFVARALGTSPSGIAMAQRSSAGSLARTVHYFRKISGTEFWPGGIAYGGDLSVYPDKA
ncbi:hypothetical protein [Sphingomonas psychrolutea]|uniref:EthD domain-containing protein n=1 Tax=Sphingomonas psychrolutea TaxID=1259676 RepID=A0ABQ1G5X1_9SPHN|nr:hypothetical protein [Sphingomonas psychrolutea]GGA37326.1 hypothetical protein GCM10011395_04550 [Sphingomonas psychrolutea]